MPIIIQLPETMKSGHFSIATSKILSKFDLKFKESKNKQIPKQQFVDNANCFHLMCQLSFYYQ